MTRPKTVENGGTGRQVPQTVQQARHAGICVHTIYPLTEFQARTGLTDSAMRAARRRGLPVLRSGKRAFVWGQDFLDFLKGKNAET